MTTAGPRLGSGSADHDVAVVGAGFAGMAAAHRLLGEGLDVVVVERGPEVGGTWRDNTYPGAACDVPSLLYSFSFAPNPHWSRAFSPQPEIQAYLRDCADRLGLRPHLRLSTEVRATRWDEEWGHWVVETDRGRCTATVVVSARGPLSEPRTPDIPGLERFEGTLFHSARWDHGHRLDGERVAVVGTGASAVQFVPQIQPLVARLHVFQRTAPWVIPRRDRHLTTFERAAFGAVPALESAVRAGIYWSRELYTLGFVGSARRRELAMALPALVARRHLRRQVADPGLRAALIPDYAMGRKRILLSDDFYPALAAPNVELVTAPIAEVTSGDIVTADGVAREVDTLILGTGFDVTGGATPHRVWGRGARTLADAWSDGIGAFRSTTVAGFPNLFLMVGPNAGLGHTSIVFVIESQVTYLVEAVRTMRRLGLASLEPTAEAQRAWNDEMARRSRQTVWTSGGCASYYLDDRGRNFGIWPGSSWGLRRALRRFDLESYRAERPSARPPAIAPPAPAAVGTP
ncbi:MAG: flavin-containing monooxygenase [Acidimicrobiales bacterium]